MPKLGQIVRVTSMHGNPKSLKGFSGKSREILAAVNNNPGLDVKQVHELVGGSYGATASALFRFRAKGFINYREQDGKFRHYAKNYVFSDKPDTRKNGEVEIITGTGVPTVDPQGLERLLKEYVWATGSLQVEELKKFLVWVNRERERERERSKS